MVSSMICLIVTASNVDNCSFGINAHVKNTRLFVIKAYGALAWSCIYGRNAVGTTDIKRGLDEKTICR